MLAYDRHGVADGPSGFLSIGATPRRSSSLSMAVGPQGLDAGVVMMDLSEAETPAGAPCP
jgi:hypothetical protein